MLVHTCVRLSECTHERAGETLEIKQFLTSARSTGPVNAQIHCVQQ